MSHGGTAWNHKETFFHCHTKRQGENMLWFEITAAWPRKCAALNLLVWYGFIKPNYSRSRFPAAFCLNIKMSPIFSVKVLNLQWGCLIRSGWRGPVPHMGPPPINKKAVLLTLAPVIPYIDFLKNPLAHVWGAAAVVCFFLFCFF